MKGIILAGGSGKRLHPLTKVISKQLLPVYDKPMIYYPLSVFMLAGIKDILIITTPIDKDSFKELLGDGSHFGINIQYEVQDKPNGLAEAFIIGEKFIGKDKVFLILGDNIFWGHAFSPMLNSASKSLAGATLFAYEVRDPQNYGVIEFDKNKKVISIEEKPQRPKSNYAATGLYFYDNNVIDIAKQITPSARGELEITDINKIYLERNDVDVQLLGRGFAWLDTGTHENLHEASTFIEVIEKRQGFKIACLEEIALRQKWIEPQKLNNHIQAMPDNSYYRYVRNIINKSK